MRCEACESIFFITQDGDSEIFPDRYYPSPLTFDELVNKIIVPYISDMPSDFTAKLQVQTADEVYIPHVNVMDHDKQDLLIPVMDDSASDSGWKTNELPRITYSAIRHQRVINTPESLEEVAANNVNILSKKVEEGIYPYFSHEIFYIQTKILKFKYKGHDFCYFAYGETIESTGASLDTILMKAKKNREILRQIISFLVFCGLATCLYFIFCMTFVENYGLLRMFLWSSGYKCIFRFIGSLFLIDLARHRFSRSWDSILEFLAWNKETRNLRKIKAKFGIQAKQI